MNKQNLNILHWVNFLIKDWKKKTKKKDKNEDKNEQKLITTTNKTENVKEITDSFKESLSPKARALVEEIKIIQEDVNYRKLKIVGGNKVTYDFCNYKTFNELFRDLYYKKMTVDKAEMKQEEFYSILDILSNYTPRAEKYIEEKNKLLDNAKNFYGGRENIIKGFKDGIFPLKSDDKFEEQQTSIISDRKNR